MNGRRKLELVRKLAAEGLCFDGGHHKQWYLEEILKALGVDLDAMRDEELEKGYDWEPGIPP